MKGVAPAVIRNSSVAWSKGVPTVAGPTEPVTPPTTSNAVGEVAVMVKVSATDAAPPE